MTGYGQGEASNRSANVVAEVRSVNHRFLDLSLKLPRNLQSRERDVKERVKRKLARGRVYVTITVETEKGAANARLNTDTMAAYLAQLRDFAGEHQVPGDVDINTLVQLPDVVSNGEADASDDELWPLVEKSLEKALDANLAMRNAEGKTLGKDLSARMKNIHKVVEKISKLAPGVSKRHAETYRKRIKELAGDVQVDEERLVTEIAMMADRLDFTEEIIRLRSHESQFNDTLAAGGEISKKLTYLLQEMHREASTIGAKASNSDVIQHVVALKEETEKIREQVQNIE